MFGISLSLYLYELQIQETAQEAVTESVYKAADSVDNYIRNTSEIMGSIYQQQSSFGFQYSSALAYLLPNVQAGLNLEHKGLVIKSFLESLIKYQPDYLYNVFLVEQDGSVSYASNPRMVSSRNLDYIFADRSWYRMITENPSKRIQTVWCTEEISDFLYRPTDRNLVLFARNIYDISANLQDNQVVATLFFSLDTSYFDSFFDYENREIYQYHIIDGEGLVLYSTNQEQIGKSFPSVSSFVADGSIQSRDIPGRSDQYDICAFPSKRTDWIIVGEVNRTLLASNFTKIRYAFSSIIIAVCFLSVLAFSFFYKLTAQPVGIIFQNIRRMEQGVLSGFTEVNSGDEFGSINRGLIQMAEKLDQHIQSSYITELRCRESELYALQSQLRPHFLLNALESIRMHLVARDDPETAHAVKLLGCILRNGLAGIDGDTTLGEERVLIQNYLDFQQYRFGNRIRLDWNIAECYDTYLIPRMILQPLIENCFKHAFSQTENGGIITLNILPGKGTYQLILRDNGVGMTIDQLTQLHNQLKFGEEPLRGEHIGLINIQDRICRRFGKKYGLSIFSMENQGTVVTLQLPEFLRGEDFDKSTRPDCR